MSPAAPTRDWLRPALICAALVVLTWLVFGQTVRFEFVNYDDHEWIVDNPRVNAGLTTDGVRWAFSRFHAGPLSSVSHMVDYDIFGSSPWGHHLSNVLLHIGATLVLFLALRSLTGGPWSSAFVSALFAIHPLRAESVAWVTERKDVLSGLFFSLSLLSYAGWARKRSFLAYAAVLACFGLGLMAKSSVVMLPLLLLLLDYWPLDRWKVAATGPLLLEKVPLLVMSGACAFATYRTHAAAGNTFEPISLGDRLAQAVAGVFIYVRQTIFPAGLSPFYKTEKYSGLEIVLAALLLATVCLAAIAWRKRAPHFFVGWFWYLVLLLPVSGIVQIAAQTRADRYTYLPQIGLWIALVWTASAIVSGRTQIGKLAGGVAFVAIVAYALAAYPVVGAWRNTETLWTRAIAVDPANDFARASFSDYLLRNDRIDEALSRAQEALRFNSRNADAHNNLALALMRKGRAAEAVSHWEQSLALNPGNLNARCNLASVLAIDPTSTVADGKRAVELVEPVAAGVPDSNPSVWQILSMAYARAERFDDAVNAGEKGRGIAQRMGNDVMVAQFDRLIALYRERRPLDDSSVPSKANSPPPLLVRPR